MHKPALKEKAISLRSRGFTYAEILRRLDKKISKSTLSLWFRKVHFSNASVSLIERKKKIAAEEARRISKIVRIKRREIYLSELREKNKHLGKLLNNRDVSKVALAILYLGEGSKNPQRGSLVFANSDPKVITLFLKLLQKCYNVEPEKFRCTVQCRADQNIRMLNNFWSFITKIPIRQFYRARIDPRTVGVISRNQLYRGVCRLDYFSAYIFNDLLAVIENITKGR